MYKRQDYDFGRDLYGGRFGTFVVKKRNEIRDKADKVQELLCSERADVYKRQ